VRAKTKSTPSEVVSITDMVVLFDRNRKAVSAMTKRPDFPRPLPLGQRHRRWHRAAVLRWLEQAGSAVPADPLAELLRRAAELASEPTRTWLLRLAAGDQDQEGGAR
jgi:predicted DNA-binding transcriptional regulator AlpA